MKKIDFSNVQFKDLQLFKPTHLWQHELNNLKYYTIIYAFHGITMIYEQNLKYVLNSGDALILLPGSFYGGIKTTNLSSFYMLQVDGKLPDEMLGVYKQLSLSSLFKELLYYHRLPDDASEAVDIITKHILVSIKYSSIEKTHSFMAHEVYAWIQTNINAEIKVTDVANVFQYNPEYISRLMTKEYGMSLKNILTKLLCQKIEDFLSNANYTIKEIAAKLQFKDSSALTHFFKYHKKMYPSEFRNLHIDNKNALKEQK